MNCNIGDRVEVSPPYVSSYVATVVGFDCDYDGYPTVSVAADDGGYYDVPTSWVELYVE
jgi:hypothetical protein